MAWKCGPWTGWTRRWSACDERARAGRVRQPAGRNELSVFVVIAGCLLSGAGIGFLGGLLGIGGGLIAIPTLGMVLDMEQQMAQGTALVMVLPTVLVAVRRYHQRERIDLGVAAAGAIGAMSCTWIGALLALGLEPLLLRRSFAVFLFCIGLYYVWQTWLRRRGPLPARSGPPPRVLTRAHALALGMLSGLLGGFFGVGGVLLVVPIMTLVYRLSQTAAQAQALAMAIPGCVVALITYTWDGQADWLVGVPLAAGSLFCVPHGVRLAHKLPEVALRGAFAIMLFSTVVLLLFASA